LDELGSGRTGHTEIELEDWFVLWASLALRVSNVIKEVRRATLAGQSF